MGIVQYKAYIKKVLFMKRNAYLDNAKVFLIFLVVFGHMIQPFASADDKINTLYIWIYTFHMPAFIFLSGFFAKGSGDINYIKKLANQLLVPYLVFQALYTGFYFLIGKEGWNGVFYPQWSLWFLLSLFSWHLLLIVYKKFNPVVGITLSLFIGVAVGYFNEIGHSFSLSRTFVFFPFFLLGYWITENQLSFVKKRSFKIFSAMMLIGMALAIYTLPTIQTGWLLASKSYADLGMREFGGIMRLIIYFIAMIMSVSVLAWIPERKNWLTVIGGKTLYVYLLHGFFIQYFREQKMFHLESTVDFIGLAFVSVAIVLFLATKEVSALWKPLIEGKRMTVSRQLNKQLFRET